LGSVLPRPAVDPPHATLSAAPARSKPEKILDVISMSGNTLSGLSGFY